MRLLRSLRCTGHGRAGGSCSPPYPGRSASGRGAALFPGRRRSAAPFTGPGQRPGPRPMRGSGASRRPLPLSFLHPGGDPAPLAPAGPRAQGPGRRAGSARVAAAFGRPCRRPSPPPAPAGSCGGAGAFVPGAHPAVVPFFPAQPKPRLPSSPPAALLPLLSSSPRGDAPFLPAIPGNLASLGSRCSRVWLVVGGRGLVLVCGERILTHGVFAILSYNTGWRKRRSLGGKGACGSLEEFF